MNSVQSEFEDKRRPRYLAAFDFDHTMVNDNTDTVVASLLNPGDIPPEVISLSKTGWTKYMQAIFALLHQAEIKPARIKKTVVEIAETAGMVKCLKTLRANNFDLIIISDSNSQFIRDWNDAHDLTNDFAQVYTNPAHFDERGMLVLKPYERQTDCNLSAVNLCKGKALSEFISRRREDKNIRYEHVFYVGDGMNDICPALRLSEADFACMRIDYSMDKRIKKVAADNNLVLRAQTIRWTNGLDLLAAIISKIKI